jgi:hypothetical protein
MCVVTVFISYSFFFFNSWYQVQGSGVSFTDNLVVSALGAECFKTRIVSDIVPQYHLYFGNEIWDMRENVRAYFFSVF